MADGEPEFGHVVDTTLGNVDGTTLVAAAAVGATTLLVEYAEDFDEAGTLLLNGAELAYTGITYGELEGDPDTITLASPLAVAADVDDAVGKMAGGVPVELWQLHVDLGDGPPVDIDIPWEQRAMWSAVGDIETPIPIFVTPDLEAVVEVPGRAPLVDPEALEPVRFQEMVSQYAPSAGAGQTFMDRDPEPADAAGLPENHGWWVVDTLTPTPPAVSKVLRFFRLVGGVWQPAEIVSGEAAYFQNALIEALQVTGLTAVDITGGLFRTAASGQRLEMSQDLSAGVLRFYTDTPGEVPGYINPGLSGSQPTLYVRPSADASFPGVPEISLISTTSGFPRGGINLNAGNVYLNGRVELGGVDNSNALMRGGLDVNAMADGGARDANLGSKYVRATVTGQLYAGTSAPSSRSIKHDIQSLDLDPELLLSLRPVTFRYNEAPGQVRVGFIAEEAHDAGLGLYVGYEDNEDPTKPTGFDYDGIAAGLVALAQRQQERIDDLEARLAALEDRA